MSATSSIPALLPAPVLRPPLNAQKGMEQLAEALGQPVKNSYAKIMMAPLAPAVRARALKGLFNKHVGPRIAAIDQTTPRGQGRAARLKTLLNEGKYGGLYRALFDARGVRFGNTMNTLLPNSSRATVPMPAANRVSVLRTMGRNPPAPISNIQAEVRKKQANFEEENRLLRKVYNNSKQKYAAQGITIEPYNMWKSHLKAVQQQRLTGRPLNNEETALALLTINGNKVTAAATAAAAPVPPPPQLNRQQPLQAPAQAARRNWKNSLFSRDAMRVQALTGMKPEDEGFGVAVGAMVVGIFSSLLCGVMYRG